MCTQINTTYVFIGIDIPAIRRFCIYKQSIQWGKYNRFIFTINACYRIGTALFFALSTPTMTTNQQSDRVRERERTREKAKKGILPMSIHSFVNVSHNIFHLMFCCYYYLFGFICALPQLSGQFCYCCWVLFCTLFLFDTIKIYIIIWWCCLFLSFDILPLYQSIFCFTFLHEA